MKICSFKTQHLNLQKTIEKHARKTSKKHSKNDAKNQIQMAHPKNTQKRSSGEPFGDPKFIKLYVENPKNRKKARKKRSFLERSVF